MKYLFVLVSAVVLASCSRMTIVTDQYWKAAVVESIDVDRLRVRIVEISVQNGIPDLSEVDLSRMPDNILLSPLYSAQAVNLSKQYPEKRFFYFGGSFPPGNNTIVGEAPDRGKTVAVKLGEGNLRNDRKNVEILVDNILKNPDKYDDAGITLDRIEPPE